MIEAFKIAASKMPASKPIVTIANVPAAVAWVRPKMSWRSTPCSLKLFWAIQEASHLPTSLVAIITIAMMSVCHPLQRSDISIIIPTPIRNKGTKRLFPTKLIRCITGLRFGTSLFIATPHMKAPRMPSNPAQSAIQADTTIMVMIIKNPLVGSDQRLKKRCVIFGKITRICKSVRAILPSTIQVDG